MPYRRLSGSSGRYALLAFDAEGEERLDDPDGAGGRLSARIVEDLASGPARDVFVLCHGWKGDVPAAADQYDRWIGAAEASAAARGRSPGDGAGPEPFRIGVHWPSQPWGDEELGVAGGASFSQATNPVDLYAERLGDRSGLKEAIAAVVEQAAEHPDAARLPPEAEQAYRVIGQLLTELGAAGEGAAPGDDREPFDPQAYFEAAREEASFGFGDLGGILAPLRQLSFWKMKQRARVVGEGGMHAFLADLQAACGGRGVRFHLMGHSFGCVVVSAMLCGPVHGARALRPVGSLALVQGAVSLWSYSADVPVQPGRPGYFRRVLDGRSVDGPILTTRSVHDTAVGRFYPLGAGVAGQVDFAPGDLPRYGALGAFGAQGLAPEAVDLPMLPADGAYAFEPGQVHNIEASAFVRAGGGASGAHNDIAGPEVANAILQAALPRKRAS